MRAFQQIQDVIRPAGFGNPNHDFMQNKAGYKAVDSGLETSGHCYKMKPREGISAVFLSLPRFSTCESNSRTGFSSMNELQVLPDLWMGINHFNDDAFIKSL